MRAPSRPDDRKHRIGRRAVQQRDGAALKTGNQSLETAAGDALAIGLIDGGGTGAELIGCVRRILADITHATGRRFEILEFDNERWAEGFDEERYDAPMHGDLLEFYEGVQRRGGVLVRGSLPAPVLYRLRRDIGQAVKTVPLNPFPAVSRFPEFRVCLLRESVHGVYHADAVERDGDRVTARLDWNLDTLRFVAAEAFRLAALTPPHRVTTVLKTSVLGDVGDLWLTSFAEESARHPGVRYAHRPSGAGFSDMWLAPREFGIVVTDDQSGDILADLVPTILYETRNLVSAGNLSLAGHASFQTDHGTIKPLVGKDAVNPVAMIGALAMALDHGLPGSGLGEAIGRTIEDTLVAGFRTQDFFSGAPQRLVGTREMTDRVLERLGSRLAAPA